MEYIIVAMVILVLLSMLINSSNSKEPPPQKEPPIKQKPQINRMSKSEKTEEAKKIASKVRTYSALERLEERLSNQSDKRMMASTDQMEANAEDKMEVLMMAVEIASGKVVKFIYVLDMDTYTSKDKLKLAYRVYSETKAAELRKLDHIEELDLHGITLEELEIDVDPIVSLGFECEVLCRDLLIKLRTIVESDMSRLTKIKKINAWVVGAQESEVTDEIDWWFCEDEVTDEMSYGALYYAYEMESDGLPFASDFYRKGYTTPEECLRVDPAEFLTWDGVDEEKHQLLVVYQEKVRRLIVTSADANINISTKRL